MPKNDREKEFEGEVRKLARRFPEMEGRFALTRAQAAAPGKAKTIASAERQRCLAWGTDPVTGKRICIRWG
jgi:hypothetical protein